MQVDTALCGYNSGNIRAVIRHDSLRGLLLRQRLPVPRFKYVKTLLFQLQLHIATLPFLFIAFHCIL